METSWKRLCLVALLALAGCAQSALLEGLDERQANEVVALLLTHNIDASKQAAGKGQYRVQVAEPDLRQAIELVQRHELPSPPRSQVAAAFPADALVSTPLGERARLISAIEQRLEETLGVMAGVHTARVHVGYDTRGASSSKAPMSMHLAAVIVHAPGVDEVALLQSVKRLLRNSFEHVSYDNVSVILSPAAPDRVMTATPMENAQGWRWGVGLAIVAVVGALVVLLVPGLRAARLQARKRLQGLVRQRQRGRRVA